MMKKSLQDQFFKDGICFGCGPANEKGLQIKSYEEGERIVAWTHKNVRQLQSLAKWDSEGI